MEEQTGIRLNRWSAACKFPSELVRKKQLLRPRRIKERLNLRSGPAPILVTVSLALILMAIGPMIFWMLIPVELWQLHSGYYGEELWVLVPYWFACFMWFGVITLLAGLVVRRFRPNSLYPPLVVDVSLLLILMVGGLVVIFMLAVLLQISATIQLAQGVISMWIIFTLLAGLMMIAGRMDKRASMVEES